MYACDGLPRTTNPVHTHPKGARLGDRNGADYGPEQKERLRGIHARMIEARRELDALIGDAYLRPRASIVPVHFLDLASAVEKLRWAEKEWRELDRETDDLEDSPGKPHLVEVSGEDGVGRSAL
jgi:hypothetical protein